VLHGEEDGATPDGELTSYGTRSKDSHAGREVEPLHAGPKLMITKTASLLDTLIRKDFTQMPWSQQQVTPETAYPVYQTLLDAKEDIAIASAGTTEGILQIKP
jgi:hypothetical protein